MTATNLAALMLIVLAKLGFSYYNVPAPCAMLVVVAGLSWPLPLTPKLRRQLRLCRSIQFYESGISTADGEVQS